MKNNIYQGELVQSLYLLGWEQKQKQLYIFWKQA